MDETAAVDVFVNKVSPVPLCLCCAWFAGRSLLSVTNGDYRINEISTVGCICSFTLKFGPSCVNFSYLIFGDNVYAAARQVCPTFYCELC